MNPPERAGFSFYKEMGGMVSADNQSENDGDEIYYMGIIDIFTQYTLRKRVEHFVKSLINDGVSFLKSCCIYNINCVFRNKFLQ
jgi:hypothetical protein